MEQLVLDLTNPQVHVCSSMASASYTAHDVSLQQCISRSLGAPL